MILSKEEATSLVEKTFTKLKLEDNIIKSISNALVKAELDNISSHGFSRIPFYFKQVLCGKIQKSCRNFYQRNT